MNDEVTINYNISLLSHNDSLEKYYVIWKKKSAEETENSTKWQQSANLL